jgi:hypothetical protein
MFSGEGRGGGENGKRSTLNVQWAAGSFWSAAGNGVPRRFGCWRRFASGVNFPLKQDHPKRRRRYALPAHSKAGVPAAGGRDCGGEPALASSRGRVGKPALPASRREGGLSSPPRHFQRPAPPMRMRQGAGCRRRWQETGPREVLGWSKGDNPMQEPQRKHAKHVDSRRGMTCKRRLGIHKPELLIRK